MTIRSLWNTERPNAPGSNEFLSREACKALFDRVASMASGGGFVSISLVSQWRSTSTWARNRVYVSSETQQTDLYIAREIRGAGGHAVTTQLDDVSLRQAVADAERTVRYTSENPEPPKPEASTDPTLQPTLWSERTAALSADERAELARQMVAPTEAAGYQSAGEIVTGAQGHAMLDTTGTFRYYPVTVVEVSANVRDAKKGASGWAGVTDFDLTRVDSAAIAARALDKAQRSANPVALEPGRYTTILEPQAVADLFTWVARMLDRQGAESMQGPFALSPGLSKISEKVLDERLRLRMDPMDPLGAFVPFETYSGDPYRQVDWIDHGILKELSYRQSYALGALGLDKPLLSTESYRLDAPGAALVTVDDMIKSTQRGLLVTRLSDVRLIDYNSALLSGYTRDGLWLIENGKITKAVKNFRFTESPIFVLNNLEQVGTAVRVFDRWNAIVVPPVKVRDFNMTALSDAV